jgi:hypothetical protein
VRVVSLDPAMTQFCGIVCADVFAPKASDDLSELRIDVLELVRKKVGVRETIQELERACAVHRPNVLIFERNIGRHFEENADFLSLKSRDGVRFKAHTTTASNKNDAQLGIQALAIDFELGRVRLPYGDVESRGQSRMLIAEATEWPYGKTDDLLMALWFIRAQFRTLRVRPEIPPAGQGKGWWMPSHLRGTRWGDDTLGRRSPGRSW